MIRWLVAIFSLFAIAAGAASAEPVDFVRDVRPILQKHCYECHAGDVRKSGLRFDIRSEAMKGGEIYGASIVAGKPEESPLWSFVADEEADLAMPPEGDRLTAADIGTLRRWIEEGAVWPDGVDTVKLEDPRDHWSFRQIESPPVPSVKQTAWPKNEIDHFILAKLEQLQLAPSAPATRTEWLRRVTFDLIGLPPTPQEVEAFHNDQADGAYERVVERLLASPRYGERWAQHWLDVVRYADTHGFEVNTERPNAWPYRDYVIEAINQDLPYDQFIRQQLAGDTMNANAATGFLVTASVLLPGQIGKDEPSKRLARQDSLDEIVTNIGTTFLGLTVHCARCHNHKFDPISQREYYQMQAFVSGVEYEDREIARPQGDMQADQLHRWTERAREVALELARHAPLADSTSPRAMINSYENVDRFAPVRTTQIRFHVKSTNSLEPCIDELEVFNADGQNVALAQLGGKVSASGERRSPKRHDLRFVNNGVYGNSSSWMSSEVGGGWVSVEFPQPEWIEFVAWGRDRQGKFTDRLAVDYVIEALGENGQWIRVADSTNRRPFDISKNSHTPIEVDSLSEEEQAEVRRLLEEKETLAKKLSRLEEKQLVFAGKFRRPDEIHVLSRGNPEMPKEQVSPGVPEVLGVTALAQDASEASRRIALADWIVSKSNPLTARVMVNRIWQGHFGMGLVETANDFGHNGVPPTHPELLDWLSAEFMQSGWSLKRMHRFIVLSAAYRQGGDYNADAAALDADDLLLWRFPPQRQMGEVIRDSILAINGNLNLEMGGPGFSLFDKRGGLTGYAPIETFGEEGLRRMIYSHRVRRERDAIFGAFDCPDYGQSTSRRRESTTSIQALNLFNSRFVLDQSGVLAERLRAEHPEPAAQINAVYGLVLLREPSPQELTEATAFVNEHGLQTLCRVLFNSNEFLFIR
ncbi:PSD1 and planctomycete cytochrome C domain-containing protein [Blastopirellula sp. JC732]|uniref:PSD1 and planctomycete cytochrome C domain-containing protein n=1 Tax=Blastopirellula sediminis TaxID=2894196 RepID=A0A9X1SJ94_9BACT|nr:PSD1 and planctomycete cytochrome C domain-containing protein [Blastopirellula sediminis]MCC9608484.1 PSD1 and planctomycete cytochrome C domain-containing protein [Blastopirellula sediminis]MCC9628739.1 PSD1 and planctomycete cytochrome C domain-containing protein [Blastopirellula sediminis]